MVDLWFHGMAVIGARSSAGLPLYSAEYARYVEEVKRQRGVYPTDLDSRAAAFGRAVSRDTAFGVFHFLPLYFVAAAPGEMLSALAAVSRQRTRDSEVAAPQVRVGALVAARALRRQDQRRVLEQFVRALEQEWAVFYRQFWEDLWRERLSAVNAVGDFWREHAARPLSGYLERQRLEGGRVVPCPALGGEGRLVTGDPRNSQDNVVAVALPLDSGAPQLPIYAMVRELCFPLVDRVVDRRGRDSAALERLRGVVAVRCGALMLEFHAPALVMGYRRAFLDMLEPDRSGDATAAAFERAYEVAPATVLALRAELRRR